MKTKTDQFEKHILQMAEQEKMILPETLYRKVDDALVSLPGRNRTGKMTWRKSIILAAALVVLCSVTVTAAVSEWRQRMEAMNAQEIEEYFAQIYKSRLGMDNYNRPYTDEERKRREELCTAYEQEAVFPQRELTMISVPEEYKGKGVAFYKDTSTFFFPKEEMSDEELLQIIDFMHRRDYSLQVMNEKIATGETAFPSEWITEKKINEEKESAMETNHTSAREEASEGNGGETQNPEQDLTIPYTGDLEIRKIAAGQSGIFLTGKSCIHKMEIGSSDSELFFDDFENDTYVNTLYEDKKGNVYLGLIERVGNVGDGTEGVTMAGGIYRPGLWILSREGAVIRKVDLLSYSGEPYGIMTMTMRMVVDEKGYIYMRSVGMQDDVLLLVLDSQGEYVGQVISEDYFCHPLGGLGIGRDGRVYTQIQSERNMGIASINLQEGRLDDIYMGIVPEGTIMLDLIAPGSGTDFVFWGYDGIFTYDLGEKSAVNILPAYEAPCDWEGVMYCALPDGRIVFGDCEEYRVEGKETFSIPEKIKFYYVNY